MWFFPLKGGEWLRHNGMGIDEGGGAADKGDVGVREDGLYTGTQLGHDLLHTLAGLGKGLGMDVGLGGYAAHVEAGAAHIAALEDHNLQSMLGSILGSAVAAGTCSYNNYISIHICLGACSYNNYIGIHIRLI